MFQHDNAHVHQDMAIQVCFPAENKLPLLALNEAHVVTWQQISLALDDSNCANIKMPAASRRFRSLALELGSP
ncbi:hypothetical protein PGIGA_G00226040 [Pangasianodon gigas]|uniref:Uncharacterized protein n=1 Tax=Pangasianodon gigas TaxID=30993 RepID=A0ACC5WJQ8_PANGG|nr:hypothetical protein [Pangasianodon gigas]